MKVVRVVAGIVCYQGKILLTRRAPGESQAGFWEFPGGKIEEGESPEASLERELLEELGLQTQVGPHLASNTHQYPTVEVQLHGYWATAFTEAVRLTVHDAAQWVLPEEVEGYALAPADIPIAAQIINHPYLS